MKSTLYVSRSNLTDLDPCREVSCIVASARERNSANCVTGMLVFTGEHFAQLLEGPEEAIDMIMASIRQDPRHHSLREFVEPVSERSFAAWSLGYVGQSTYVDRRVKSLLAAAPDSALSNMQAEFRNLMLLFAHQDADAAVAPA